MKMRSAAFVMMLFASISFRASPARACSCLVDSAPAARDAAVIVFEGELLRLAPARGADAPRAVFRLSRVWKGRPTRELTVVVRAQPDLCPPHLDVGQTYILYATGTLAEPRITRCSRHATGAGIEAEREALGPPTRTFR